MRRFLLRTGWLVVLCPGAAAGQAATPDPGRLPVSGISLLDYWPQWRGPLGTGVGPKATPPTTWSEKQNLRWKVEVPGSGHATPVVWGDKVIVTTAIPYGEKVDPVPDDAPGAHDNAPLTFHQEFAALAFSRQDGTLLWKTPLRKYLPHAGAHKSGTHASSSPATDGEHVFAYFGSSGLYCLDMDGKPVWSKDLGDMQVKHGHGEGSSPVLHGDTIAVPWDHEGDSFLVALDKRTGAERWRVARDEVTSWSTPVVYVQDRRAQLLVSGTAAVRSYDLLTGGLIWQARGLAHNVVASPVAADGIAIFSSSYEKRAMFAVRLQGAKGDITATDRIAWRRQHRTPYVPSPLLYGEWLYFLNHYQGVLTRVRAKTGEEPSGPFRLPQVFELYASPVGAAGRIYFADRDGTTVVLTHEAAPPRIVAVNRLDDGFNASPALAGRDLFLRGTRFLYCIAEPAQRPAEVKQKREEKK